MFLKRIETVGFKSFADRTTVEFVPGITAVVGPNGSGKSNVIDAVRWVLGEQSAKSLRGSKMEDIIFQGSDSRKALNFAEVTLVLNNEKKELPIEYNEVSITRRVYRSGDSEFYVNKQPCRLKDIVDLFMDTGLGRESFSIIGQGKIDEILSSKAEDRRAIFEEAAGVLKYKQRKQKAEVKLEETSQNLARVEDIMYEMKEQLEPLKEQAEKAHTFNAKKETLREVEVSLLITEIHGLHEEWQLLLKQIEQEKNDELQQKTTIQQRESKLIEVREQLKSLENKLEILQEKQLVKTERIEQLEGKKSVLHERVKHVSENRKKLEEEKKTQEEKRSQAQNRIEEEQIHLNEVNESLEDIRRKINSLQKDNNQATDTKKDQIERLKSEYIDALNEQAALRNEESSITHQLEQVKQRITTQQTSSKQYIDQRKKNNEAETTLLQALQEKKLAIDENEQRIIQINETKQRLESTYNDMQRKLYEGNERIATIASRKEMLEEMKNNFQGYFYGVKEILQAVQKGKIDSIEGVVIDLIDVPTTYMTAIDTILGAQAQHVVVKTDAVARNIIQWLKKENKGRATFLPLGSIEKRGIPSTVIQKIETEDGYVGIASNLVKVHDHYRIVVDHLMGNAIVTKDLKSATTIAAKTNRRFRIVTLDGDVVYPGGSMSGGAKKQQNVSLFTREKELKSLEGKLVQFTNRKNKFLENMSEVKRELECQVAELQKITEEQQKLDYSYGQVQMQLNDLNVKVAQTEDQLVSYELYMKQYAEEKETLVNKHKETTERLLVVSNKITETEQLIDQYTKELQSLEEAAKTTEDTVHELEKTEIELKERHNHFLERQRHHRAELVEIEKTLDNIVVSLNEMDQVEQLSEDTNSIEKEILTFKNELEILANEIEESRKNRTEQYEWIQDEQKEIRGLDLVHQKAVKTIQQLEVQANRLDVTLENRLQFLQTEYVMTYEYAKDHFDFVEDIEQAGRRVKEIKRAIQSLGTVNLGAIEEYERIKTRYEFLAEQQADLIDAKETLYTVIKEMDKEMTERFEAVFFDIQQAFMNVFTQLFGGGRASLTLTDPENMLMTGIDIVAQPPGKKLQSLDLLSGGERALTAIALLFAILRTRPVPFVILDEVDAALDEANVIRFSQYLKTYREETQFIVITHRNGTMEEADVLYGVTMQESGVSKLVSVRLEEAMN